MPRKIRQLVADLEKAGFTQLKGAGKGSHRKFSHPKARSVILSGANGDDARHYQESDVKKAIKEAQS
jgi:predicted RNA binding protein YcfA (HicA-like mRNA interferase family)